MSKTDLFENDLQETAALFKVLAHPARLSILKYLAKTKICMTGDITRELPLGRTTINQHLAALKEMDLIHGEIEGVKVNYCLNTKKIEAMLNRLKVYFEGIILRN